MKPRIGINSNWVPDPHYPAVVGARANYVNAVVAAGGIPIILPIVEDCSASPEIISAQTELCDGFVFIGGPDIDPSRYDEEPHEKAKLLPPCRETYDFALIQEVLRLQKPFLAICLGCQEVNVALGGSLVQDIECQLPESQVPHTIKEAPLLPRHDVVIEPDSRLAELVGDLADDGPQIVINTNSAHHQAVSRLGRGVRPVARCCEDGIVEAFEIEGYPFGLGIQWHPEYLQAEAAHRRLFEGLVEASRVKHPAELLA